MCGIVGVAGDMNLAARKSFTELLHIDVFRGKDSTGVAAIGRNSWKVHKTVGTPQDLFERVGAKDGIESLSNICLIGHNRYATVGGVNRGNAHPFEFENLVGVHNGTLRNKEVLEDYKDFGTDSEALYYNIDKNGLKETMSKVIGAYTLVWFDKRTNTINFLRNQERPLAIALSEDKKFLFWASEKDMLEYVLNRNNIKYGIVELPVDTHYSWKIPMSFNTPFDKPSASQVKGKEVDYSVTEFNKQTNNQRFQGNRIQSVTKKDEKGPEKIRAGEFKLPDDPVGRVIDLTYSYCGTNVFREQFVTARVAGDGVTEYRLYFTRPEQIEAIKMHKHFRAMVSRIEAIKYIGGHVLEYYVLTPHQVSIGHQKDADNVKRLTLVSNTAEDLQEDDIPDTAFEEPTVVDHNGNEVSREQFSFRYSQCGWCDQSITYGDKYMPLSPNACLCESCSKDQDVLESVGYSLNRYNTQHLH